MPENITEYRGAPIEFREGGGPGRSPGVADGVVIRYGDEATFPGGLKERFEPGAFGDLKDARLKVNRMHRRSEMLARSGAGTEERGGWLTVDNTDERLYGKIGMPDTQRGHDACTEMRLGLLTGQSIEFRAIRESYVDEVRVIKEARLFGWGIVDDPAYGDSSVTMRSWDDYMRFAERRSQWGGYYDLSASQREDGGCRGCASCGGAARGAAPGAQTPEPEMRYAAFDCEFEYSNGALRFVLPYGDDREIRQVPNAELNGRLPYGVDGVVSMQRGEKVRFLPGCFSKSLRGEIILLAGNSYEEPLANSEEGTLVLRDTDDALEFEARDLPDTTYAHNFLGKLSKGLIRGLTAGWANAGSKTETEDLPDGGKRIVVQEATLCEFYPRSRSVAPGGGIQARRPRRQEERRVVF